MTPIFLTGKQVKERFGWSHTTIWRKVKQGCFPCYRFSHTDVKFKLEEILYYCEGKKEGSFEGVAA